MEYIKDKSYRMKYVDKSGNEQEKEFKPSKDTNIAGMINEFKEQNDDFFKLKAIDDTPLEESKTKKKEEGVEETMNEEALKNIKANIYEDYNLEDIDVDIILEETDASILKDLVPASFWKQYLKDVDDERIKELDYSDAQENGLEKEYQAIPAVKEYTDKMLAEFNKLKETVKYYNDNGKRYIELNANHTLNDVASIEGNDDIDNDEIIDKFNELVSIAIDSLQEEIGEDVYTLGRMGRHICIENTYENAMNYEAYKEVQETFEKQVIEEMKEWVKDYKKSESKEITESKLQEGDEEEKNEEECIECNLAKIREYCTKLIDLIDGKEVEFEEPVVEESKELTESRDRVAEKLPAFIYHLGEENNETAWSANAPAKVANGITVYEVYKNGKSQLDKEDIKDQVLSTFEELKVYGETDSSIFFYKPEKKTESFDKNPSAKDILYLMEDFIIETDGDDKSFENMVNALKEEFNSKDDTTALAYGQRMRPKDLYALIEKTYNKEFADSLKEYVDKAFTEGSFQSDYVTLLPLKDENGNNIDENGLVEESCKKEESTDEEKEQAINYLMKVSGKTREEVLQYVDEFNKVTGNESKKEEK